MEGCGRRTRLNIKVTIRGLKLTQYFDLIIVVSLIIIVRLKGLKESFKIIF